MNYYLSTIKLSYNQRFLHWKQEISTFHTILSTLCNIDFDYIDIYYIDIYYIDIDYVDIQCINIDNFFGRNVDI